MKTLFSPKTWLPAAGIIGLVLIWQATAWFVSDPLFLPSPLATTRAAWQLLAEGYWRDLLATSARALSAWILALALGVPVGLLLGLWSDLYDSCRAVLAFLRSLPSYLLITVFVVMGHSGEIARVGTVMLASAWIIADECAESLCTLPPSRIDVLRAFRASSWFILTRALVFEALGRTIIPAARTTIGICFVVSTVVEALAVPTYGVGARLLNLFAVANMAPVFGFLLLTGLMGVLLNAIVHRSARLLIFWS
jgi:ABC-type nitrate/sulfonate/bicarbonate transport system permease component